ncbi:MAG: hypothetical protein Q7T03_10210 [Deltaproteobacteria bacterium]|nr:hypothetical protein [Deltaproteobacteria bacterium]
MKMKMKMKTYIAVFSVVSLLLFSIFLFRNFFIKWGGNFFLFPYSVHLTKVETELTGFAKISFIIEGSSKSAPLEAKGTFQLLPLRFDFQKIQISRVPAAELNPKISLICGYTAIEGMANIQAKGWVQTTQIDVDVDVVLFDGKVVKAKKTFLNLEEGLANFLAKNGKDLHTKIHMSGNVFKPDITCKH